MKKTKKAFTLAEAAEIASKNMKFAVFAKKTPVKQTRKEFPFSCAAASKQTGSEFPSSCAAAAEQTGSEFPSSCAAAAEQMGSEFPSSGGVSAKQTGWLQAFTLAETLIALTIIGVIAAITVPALIQRTNKQEYAAALQKAYSTLSRAANQIIAEEGSILDDENGESPAKDPVNLYNLFKKHLNVLKDCGTAPGCIKQLDTDKKLYDINGNNIWGWAWRDRSIAPAMVLADGMQVMYEGIGCSSENDKCAIIIVDVNGEKKPNTTGRDVFIFDLYSNGLRPRVCSKNNGLGTYGDCGASKVLREGAMNY